MGSVRRRAVLAALIAAVFAVAVAVVSTAEWDRPAPGAPRTRVLAADATPAPSPDAAAAAESSPPPEPAQLTSEDLVEEANAPKKPRPGAIGTIEIPRIGLAHDFFEGIDLSIVAHGPGHWPGTAMPGWPGNSVFAGHRVTNTRPFRNIDRLSQGDLVHFTVRGVRHTYKVTEHLVVAPTDVWITNPTTEPTATLFACHPPGSARQRYVVRLALVKA